MNDFRVMLDAYGQRTETIRRAETESDAAEQALLGWHRDARLTGKARAGKDLYGPYHEFSAKAGKSWGRIVVRPPYSANRED